MKDFVRAIGAGLLVLCMSLGSAQANVVIGGARVVFPAAEGETTLRLSNEGDQPALVCRHGSIVAIRSLRRTRPTCRS